MSDMTVNEIWIYPIKSTRGLMLSEAEVEHCGLHRDRRWMLVDANDKFITQRECGAMALIQAQAQNGGWRINAPGMPELQLQPPSPENARIHGQIWRQQLVPVVVADADINQWFSQYLQQPVRAVYQHDSHGRLINEPQARPDDQVSLADGYPLLLIGTASLADLNTRLTQPVDMRHFRPNIVAHTDTAFIEDTWREIRIGAVHFDVVKTCARCVMTTRNPDTGELHEGREPLRTLSQYRRREGGVMFGQNLIPRSAGRIRAGDRIEVLSLNSAD